MAMVGRPAVVVPAIFLMARQETTDDAQTSGHSVQQQTFISFTLG
jgi:hypothetical protein